MPLSKEKKRAYDKAHQPQNTERTRARRAKKAKPKSHIARAPSPAPAVLSAPLVRAPFVPQPEPNAQPTKKVKPKLLGDPLPHIKNLRAFPCAHTNALGETVSCFNGEVVEPAPDCKWWNDWNPFAAFPFGCWSTRAGFMQSSGLCIRLWDAEAAKRRLGPKLREGLHEWPTVPLDGYDPIRSHEWFDMHGIIRPWSEVSAELRKWRPREVYGVQQARVRFYLPNTCSVLPVRERLGEKRTVRVQPPDDYLYVLAEEANQKELRDRRDDTMRKTSEEKEFDRRRTAFDKELIAKQEKELNARKVRAVVAKPKPATRPVNIYLPHLAATIKQLEQDQKQPSSKDFTDVRKDRTLLTAEQQQTVYRTALLAIERLQKYADAFKAKSPDC